MGRQLLVGHTFSLSRFHDTTQTHHIQ